MNIKLIILLCIWSNHSLSESAAQGVLSHYDVYSKRPKISDVENIKTTENDERLIEGLVVSTILAVEIYSGYEFHFLARDAEYAFDIASLIYSNNKAVLSRLHLDNISTALAYDSNQLGYLKQSKLSMQSLSRGSRHLFFETGFHGSVPEAIIRNFPYKYRKQFNIFLLESHTSRHNSVGAFLEFGDGKDIEQLPHYTRSGKLFYQDGDSIEVLSHKQNKKSQNAAIRFMGKIRSYVLQYQDYINELRSAVQNAVRSNDFDGLRSLQDYFPIEKMIDDIKLRKINQKNGTLSYQSSEMSDDILDKTFLYLYGHLSVYIDALGLNEFVKQIIFKSFINSESLDKHFYKIVYSLCMDHITADEFELFEDLLSISLHGLSENYSARRILGFLERANQLEAEESLEKIIPAIVKIGFKRKNKTKFVGVLKKIIKNFESYSDVMPLTLIFIRSFATKENIFFYSDVLRDLFKALRKKTKKTKEIKRLLEDLLLMQLFDGSSIQGKDISRIFSSGIPKFDEVLELINLKGGKCRKSFL